MTRHLNLLVSQAQAAAARPSGLPLLAVPGVLAGVLLAALAAAGWSHLTGQRLAEQAKASQAPVALPGGTATLSPTVIAALERQVRERESLARALNGDMRGVEAPAAASRWLEALAEAARPGVAVNTMRLDPGPRLTLSGSGLQPTDINGFIARLQAHPLAGTAAIGQLEMRRGESAGDALAFRLTPPPPEGWAAGGTPAPVSTAEARPQPTP